MNKNLPTLSILHYVYGALICLGGFAALMLIGVGVFMQSDLVMDGGPDQPPEWLGAFFQAFGVAIFVVLELWGVFVILSGHWISKKRNRTGSIVIAALSLLSFPFGTALGVFTLVALMNDEVKAEYEVDALRPM